MTTEKRTTFQKIKRIVLWLLSPIALILALAVIWFPLSKLNILPPFLRTAAFKPLRTPESRDAQWQQDLDYYAGQLPRLHKDVYHATDRAAFDQAVADLSADIPDLTEEEIIVRFMQLTAKVGDGHTAVRLPVLFNESFGFHRYPLGIKGYADGWHIVGGLPEYEALIGARLVAVETTPTGEVFDTVRTAVSHDNEMQLRSLAGTYMMTPEVLYGLGLVEQVESATFTVETLEGETRDVTVSAIEPQALQDAITLEAFFGENDIPRAMRNEDRWYWYEYLPEDDTVYFQYDRCGNMKDQRFKDFNEELMAFVDDHDVRRIVVDLRYNGGGNSLVLKPFLKALEARSDLSVYTLIGRQTFSSALMNAVQLKRQGATLVGEPTGGRPNHYGEVRMFRLPNSKLPILYATRYFEEFEESDPPSLQPDIPVAITIEDQLAGRDTVLQAALP